MRRPVHHSGSRCDQGYTLVELMVVLAIAGILAAAVVWEFADPRADVKAGTLGLRTDLNMARFEAVSRNQTVRVDFLLDTDLDGDGDADDGYRIWIDDFPAGAPDGTYTEDPDPTLADTLIRVVPFPDGVELYDIDFADGPDTTPSGGALVVTDGVSFSFGNNFTTFQSNGTAVAGTVYLYYPDDAGAPTEMRVAPYAVVLSSVGRVRVRVWRDGAWQLR
ncbi:MAG: GspH/FimT family protein [Thermodesulfobacteriota bacterium]